MDPGILDRLRALGCNISVTSFDGFFVQLTLMHGSDFCGHTARVKDPHFAPALKGAVLALLQAADGSKCGVDVAELRRIALAVSA